MEDKFHYMLAPMEDYSDSSFRSICKDADLTFTEMVRIDALVRNNNPSLRRIELHDNTPVQIQIMGNKEKIFEKFLKDFKPSKGFQGFNLNIGCPSKNVVNQGLGCAMIKRIAKVKRIVDLIKSKGYSCSVKLRLGMNLREKERKVYLNLINGVDAEFFVVHAKHGKESYKGKSDWSVFEDCVATGKDIIANGDIKNKEDVEYLKKIGVKGVMIGREAVLDPTIFSKLKGKKKKKREDVMKEFEKLMIERNANDIEKRLCFDKW